MTVDYFSDFFEEDCMYSMTSEAVVVKLKGHIARYKKLDEILSDNGPQFAAEEFYVFTQAYGFNIHPPAHTTLSPMARLNQQLAS